MSCLGPSPTAEAAGAELQRLREVERRFSELAAEMGCVDEQGRMLQARVEAVTGELVQARLDEARAQTEAACRVLGERALLRERAEAVAQCFHELRRNAAQRRALRSPTAFHRKMNKMQDFVPPTRTTSPTCCCL